MTGIKKYAKRLRIYIGESDKYDRIVKKAKELDIAGVTVFPCVLAQLSVIDESFCVTIDEYHRKELNNHAVQQ